MSPVARPDPALLRAFAARVRAQAERQVERELADAGARRRAVLERARSVVSRWRAQGGEGRIWLFGSYAWGTPDEHSDIDLMVADVARADADALAQDVASACALPVHLVHHDAAAAGLRRRVEEEGLPL